MVRVPERVAGHRTGVQQAEAGVVQAHRPARDAQVAPGAEVGQRVAFGHHFGDQRADRVVSPARGCRPEVDRAVLRVVGFPHRAARLQEAAGVVGGCEADRVEARVAQLAFHGGRGQVQHVPRIGPHRECHCVCSPRRSPPRPTRSHRSRPTAPASRRRSTRRPESIRRRRRCARRRWWRCAAAPETRGSCSSKAPRHGPSRAGCCNAPHTRGLRDEILAQLRAALPVDLVVLGLHGAMVAQGYDDCEGDLLERARAIVGPHVPIAAGLDPHSHLTARRVLNANILTAFLEFPHTDFVGARRASGGPRVADGAGRGQAGGGGVRLPHDRHLPDQPRAGPLVRRSA